VSTSRRELLGLLGGVALGPFPARPALLKPPRLRPGDTVGLFASANATFLRAELEIATESLSALGLKVKQGAHLLDRYGYFAGRDRDRAADVNALFADPGIKGVMAIRGGWGSARVLPFLDYDLIRRNPKVLMGYSDLTAILNAVHARTGLVTFHGPVGVSTWTPFSVEHMRRVLFDGEAPTLANPVEVKDTLVQVEDRVQTIVPGVARGRLLGGNLTVLTSIVGTTYLPDWDGAILFIEDVREQIYRIDRMLTQLALAGILGRLRGVVFGKCTRCDPGEGYGSLTLEEVFDDHLKPLGVPAWQGAMIGHVDEQWTVPIGLSAEIDAGRGTLKLLEPAVS
jgi:muramoyltetrapeptide carboxypeptidase